MAMSSDDVGAIIAMLVAIMLAWGIPRMPVVGVYFEKYPVIIVGLAVLLWVFRKKITSMIKK